MRKRHDRARISKSQKTWQKKTQRAQNRRQHFKRSLNPYVIHRDGIRADEAQLHFWKRLRYLETQGLIPQWLCVCREGYYLSCLSCGSVRNCRDFPIEPSTRPTQVKCKCGKKATDEWHCPPCLKRIEYQNKRRRKRSTYWVRVPGSITQ